MQSLSSSEDVRASALLPPLLRVPVDCTQAYWSLAFALAFITMNVPLLPGLGGEYQPLLFALLAVVALARVPVIERSLLFHTLLLSGSLLLMALWHALSQTLDQISFVRCNVGVVFLICAGPLLMRLTAQGLVALIWGHIIFALLGLALPDAAKSIVGVLGLRGLDYYEGWNAFTASEPSYAALNISALTALLMVKDGSSSIVPRRTATILGVALVLICTKSVTGLALAILHLAPLLFSMLRKLLAHRLLVILALMVLVTFIVASLRTGVVGDENMSRVGNAIATVFEVFRAGSLLPFFLIEPSGAWRLLTNFGGVMTAFNFPAGTGALSLHEVIFSVLPSQYAEFVESSSVFVVLDGEFAAQTPLANIAVFGGLLPTVVLLALGFRAVKHSLSAISLEAKVIVAGYLLVGLFWQGTLTAPGWWLVVGAVMTFQSSRAVPAELSSRALS